jgi:hypothetical protein
MVAHASNLSPWEAKAGGLRVPGCSWNIPRPGLKNKRNKIKK